MTLYDELIAAKRARDTKRQADEEAFLDDERANLARQIPRLRDELLAGPDWSCHVTVDTEHPLAMQKAIQEWCKREGLHMTTVNCPQPGIRVMVYWWEGT